MNIAFIGTGIMGQRMAANLIKAGHALTVCSRTRQKAETLLAQGATWADSAGAAVKDADCVITMVGTPQDVEQIYFGGILDNAKPSALLIDMTTSSPRLAERIHAAAKVRGACALDAPVTGGPPGAETGTLTIMVGGDRADFDRAVPILSKLGTTLAYFNAPGNGQRAKLVNQVVAMQNIIGAIEGLFLARKAGLDGDTMLHTLQNGMADSKSLRNSAAKAIKEDFAPNFNPAHVVKDLTLAIEEADALGLDLPGLKNARARWQELVRRFPNARAVQEVARLYM
jgi:3-hydroxyisobutyrate dehydrogenase